MLPAATVNAVHRFVAVQWGTVASVNLQLSAGSQNGDNYSGDIFRIVVTRDDQACGGGDRSWTKNGVHNHFYSIHHHNNINNNNINNNNGTLNNNNNNNSSSTTTTNRFIINVTQQLQPQPQPPAPPPALPLPPSMLPSSQQQQSIRTLSPTHEAVHLIAKSAPQKKMRRLLFNSANHFAREQFAYETILPTFEQFQRRQLCGATAPPPFTAYPTMLASTLEPSNEVILFDDLAASGFRNADRPTPLGYDKCALVMRQLAHFHAVSFAMKDQNRVRFKEMVAGLSEITFRAPVSPVLDEFLRRKVSNALSTLDAIANPGDATVIAKLAAFQPVFAQSMVECVRASDDAIVCHGDCWISNLMFRKKDEVKFLDWQTMRYCTPAVDLSYFVFCCTDRTLRERLPELLCVYHVALTERIAALGSDAAHLFPYARLEEHMQRYARFGLGMALMTLHTTCCSSTDLPDVIGILDSTDMWTNLDDIMPSLIAQPAYRQRMADVCRDMVRFGYL